MTNSIHTDEMTALRYWLRSEREVRKLSMRGLADRMNKPHSFVQKVEQGERRLDVVEYVWYCSALEVDPQEGLSLVLTSVNTSKH